jgi:SAM-dependent methyltransferase
MIMDFEKSHQHALEVLNLLYDHDDFMETIKSVADMGAGRGLDAEWWATRTTRDDEKPAPLNIKVQAEDNLQQKTNRISNKNISWLTEDFSKTSIKPDSIDFVWCHNSFQFSKNPLATLAHWYSIMKEDAMLCLTVPYELSTYEVRDESRINATMMPGCYFNYTPINLIMLLATSGFDCRGGHFKFIADDPWIYCAVYKSEHKPQDYMNWTDLLGKKLLPISIEKTVEAGPVNDRDLLVEWIDHSIYNLAIQ